MTSYTEIKSSTQFENCIDSEFWAKIRFAPAFLMVRLETLIFEEPLKIIPLLLKPSIIVFAGSSPIIVIPDFW